MFEFESKPKSNEERKQFWLDLETGEFARQIEALVQTEAMNYGSIKRIVEEMLRDAERNEVDTTTDDLPK